MLAGVMSVSLSATRRTKILVQALIVILVFPVVAEATVNCSSSLSTFVITSVGSHYQISGDLYGMHKGHCEAEFLRSTNGHVLLQGTDSDDYFRHQCYADIVLGQKYSSEVSVPDDKTYGAVKEGMLLCTGDW
jgi:hypothetical protein